MKEIRAWKWKTNSWSIRWLIECLLLPQLSPELCPTSPVKRPVSGSDQAESTRSGPEAVQFSTVWSAERLIWRGSGVTDLRSLTRVQTSSFHSPALPGALLVLCNLRTRSALLNVLLPNLFNSEFIMMHLISTFSNRTQCSELVLHLEKCSFTRNQT